MVSILSKAIAIALLFTSAVHAEVISDNVKVKDDKGKEVGMISYNYDASLWFPCTSVIIVGVGTQMKYYDYNELGKDMSNNTGIVTIIADFNGGLIKLNPVGYVNKYATLVNAVADQLTTLIPNNICKKAPSKGIFIGGHSASGRAAVNALEKELITFKPAGLFLLDPFDVYVKKDKIDIPTMAWGFAHTTCFAKVDNAALAAYEISPEESRVLYRISNPSGQGKRATHCSFSDTGCFACPSNTDKSCCFWVHPAVGKSAPIFVNAVASNNFAPSKFAMAIGDNDVECFVGGQSALAPSGQQAQPAFA